MTTPGSYGPGEQPPGGAPGWGQPAGVPPPGQFPQGQYPPPQGQYPQGQAPQGQYPPQQGQFGQQPYPLQGQVPSQGQGWPAPPKKGGNGKWIAIGVGILVALAVLVLLTVSFGPAEPDPGDCLQTDGTDLSIVDCDDSAAQYRYLGTQSGQQTYEEYVADPETCSEFPEAIQSFWVGDEGEKGDVYCAGTV
jgi:hypothetical protein